MSTEGRLPPVGATAPVAMTAPVADLVTELASHASALPLPSAGSPPASSAVKTELSSAGKQLLALLTQLSSAGTPPAAPPLLDHPDRSPAVIAQALRQGIEHSGLFYESHLADWIDGHRDLAAIRQEPQATLKQEDPTTAAIMRQQLDLLDGQPLHWRGEWWPGQALQLRLWQESPQPPPEPDAAGASEPVWQTTLSSTLPALGDVVAMLRIEGNRLQLRLSANDDKAAALMATHAASLREALSSAGLQLQAFGSHVERQA